MTKEYEIKTKIEQEHWLQLKMLFLLGYNWKLLFSGGVELTFGGEGEGNKNLVVWEDFSSWGGGMSKFSAGGRGLPPSPPFPPPPHPPQKGKPIVVLCGVVFRLCWNVF